MNGEKHKSTYRALLDFNSKINTDLVVRKGDILKVYTSSMNENWWKVKNQRTRKKGLIPKNFLIKSGLNYENYEGFFKLTRKEAHLKLMIPSISCGTFLVRPTSNEERLALSVKFESSPGVYDVGHYELFQKDKKIFIHENMVFDNIFDLVHYYSVNPILRAPLNEIYANYFSLPPMDKSEIPRDQIRLDRKIGIGNFGEVYAGLWCGQIEIAVKIINNPELNSDKCLEEAKIIQKLQHPNILQLIGICSKPKNQPFYLITEYMPFGNIKNFLLIKTSKEISTEHLIEMIYQTAVGMEYLSLNNVVHRDLRGDNILISNDYVIKIADFGLARIIQDFIYMSTSYDTNYPMKWAAPELIRTGNQFSEKTDVWSFGITCYEILSRGGTPYPGENPNEVMNKVKNGYTLPFPFDFVCPKDVKRIISSCWKLNPHERPTFSELVKTLKERYNR